MGQGRLGGIVVVCSLAMGPWAGAAPPLPAKKVRLERKLQPDSQQIHPGEIGAATLESISNREALERHALAAPPEAEATTQTLAHYLVAPARTDIEKAWVLFRWITDRIAYDSPMAAADVVVTSEMIDPDRVLALRKTVCSGYVSLFVRLASHVGLEAVEITGSGKEDRWTQGNTAESDHSWTAFRGEDGWYLMDATWGAGTDDEEGFHKELNLHYFMTRPEQMILDHFPMDGSNAAAWQLLRPAKSIHEYESWPHVDEKLLDGGLSPLEAIALTRERGDVSPQVFALLKAGLPIPSVLQLVRRGMTYDQADQVASLLQMGVPAPTLLSWIREGRGLEVATVYESKTQITIDEIPLGRQLVRGKTYRFSLRAPDTSKVVFLVDGAFQTPPLTRTGDRFTGTIVARGTNLMISRQPEGKKSYWGILGWEVSDAPAPQITAATTKK